MKCIDIALVLLNLFVRVGLYMQSKYTAMVPSHISLLAIADPIRNRNSVPNFNPNPNP